MHMPNKAIACLKLFLTIIMVGGFLFFAGSFDKKDVLAQEGDAIAVRVMPNPKHYSSMTWYQKQGFKGSPTAMTVDGYDAVRDGRTVYVNVANVSAGTCFKHGTTQCFSDADCPADEDACNLAGKNLYTNIYLISYNQAATPETETIFTKILGNWKFNVNINNRYGSCIYQPDVTQQCLLDSDCTGGGFCKSLKSELIRDIKRLGIIIDLREKLSSYASVHGGTFPKLSAGTYISGKTISVWPSWSGEFASELGGAVPTDPINKLNGCDGDFDPITCWNQKDKTFKYSSGDDPIGGILPDNYIFKYFIADAKAQRYSLCAEMESGFLTTDSLGACSDGSSTDNHAPTISCGSLTGIADKPFDGYVTVKDQDNNKIVDFRVEGAVSPAVTSFSFSTSTAQIKVHANSVLAGKYSFKVTASDDKSATSEATCNITITPTETILYPVADQKVHNGKDLKFSVYAYNSSKNYDGLNFRFSIKGRNDFSCYASSTAPDGRRKCDMNIPASSLSSGVNSSYVNLVDAGGLDVSAAQNFNIDVYNNPPVIQSIKCDKTSLRKAIMPSDGEDFNCSIKVSDPDGDPTTLNNPVESSSTGGMGLGLRIENSEPVNGSGIFNITGSSYPYGRFSADAGTHLITVSVSDNLGRASTEKTVAIKILTFCGDGELQSPNDEHKGGPKNDGYEQCDGFLAGGKTNSTVLPINSSQTNQYNGGCSSSCTITSNNDGWCGDGITQPFADEKCDPGTGNIAAGLGCKKDCSKLIECTNTSFGGKTCSSYRDINGRQYTDGSLSCNSDSTINISSCYYSNTLNFIALDASTGDNTLQGGNSSNNRLSFSPVDDSQPVVFNLPAPAVFSSPEKVKDNDYTVSISGNSYKTSSNEYNFSFNNSNPVYDIFYAFPNTWTPTSGGAATIVTQYIGACGDLSFSPIFSFAPSYCFGFPGRISSPYNCSVSSNGNGQFKLNIEQILHFSISPTTCFYYTIFSINVPQTGAIYHYSVDSSYLDSFPVGGLTTKIFDRNGKLLKTIANPAGASSTSKFWNVLSFGLQYNNGGTYSLINDNVVNTYSSTPAY